MLLRFFGFSIVALEVRQGHVRRFVSEPDADGIHRNTFLVQCIGVGLAAAVKLGTLDTSLLGDGFELAQEVPVRFAFTV